MIVVVTQCLKVKKELIIFHYKGTFLEEKIDCVLIRSKTGTFRVGDNYIIVLGPPLVVKKGAVTGKILKWKRLE